MSLASRKSAFKRSTKTPRVAKKAIKLTKQASRLPPPDDYVDSQATEDEDWVQDLREYLKKTLTKLSRRNKPQSRTSRSFEKSGSHIQTELSAK